MNLLTISKKAASRLAILFCIVVSGCAESEISVEQIHPAQCFPSEHENSRRTNTATGRAPTTIRLLDGTERNLFNDESTRLVVVVFTATDCPIANAYLPKLERLQADYRSSSIEILLVHSNQETDVETAREHAKHFQISLPIVMDPAQTLAKKLNAKVTPEAMVISRDKEIPVYRGAIDNLFADFGKKRRFATKHYLEIAIESVLSGNEVAIPKTNPIGCFISYDD